MPNATANSGPRAIKTNGSAPPTLQAGVIRHPTKPCRPVKRWSFGARVGLSAILVFGLWCTYQWATAPETPVATEPLTRQQFLAKMDARYGKMTEWNIKEPDSLVVAGGDNLKDASGAAQLFSKRFEAWHEDFKFNTFVFVALNGDACISDISDRDPTDYTWSIHCYPAADIPGDHY